MSTEILVAFSAPDSGALGNIWRITAKKTDFYLDALGGANAFHLSVHGPNDRHPDGHRFHVTVDRKAAAAVEARGDFILYDLPRKGRPFDGQGLAPNVFRVARIRWRWDLQRPRFRQAAAFGPLPSTLGTAARLGVQLEPNEAIDLDLFVSYAEPHWPDEERSLRDNSRLGPLRNDAGMWLTATAYRRSQLEFPAPEPATPPLPKAGEEPVRLLGGGPAEDETGDMYWFVESITSREVIEASRPNSSR